MGFFQVCVPGEEGGNGMKFTESAQKRTCLGT